MKMPLQGQNPVWNDAGYQPLPAPAIQQPPVIVLRSPKLGWHQLAQMAG